MSVPRHYISLVGLQMLSHVHFKSGSKFWDAGACHVLTFVEQFKPAFMNYAPTKIKCRPVAISEGSFIQEG